MATGNVHTSWDEDRQQWKNEREGSSRVSSYHDTADDASQAGQRYARDTGSEWLKHRKDNGQIHERNTYGEDPHPPEG